MSTLLWYLYQHVNCKLKHLCYAMDYTNKIVHNKVVLANSESNL